MRDGFVKVAAGTPSIRVADCRYNAEQIFTLMREAAKQGVKVRIKSLRAVRRWYIRRFLSSPDYTFSRGSFRYTGRWSQ